MKNNLSILIGTRAQLIKMAPLLKLLSNQKVPFKFIWSGQHQTTISDLLIQFQLPRPDIYLVNQNEAKQPLTVAKWFWRAWWQGLKKIPKAKNHRNKILIVHGDTLSTLLGAAIGRLKKYQVAHVEAGLRSGHLWEPFPEEITRRLVSKLAQIHFCPGEHYCQNINAKPEQIVNTVENTMLDTVQLLPSQIDTHHLPLKFVLFSMHRFENLFQPEKFIWCLQQLILIAKQIDVLFVLHPATQKQLLATGYLEILKNEPKIHLIPRLSFFNFANLTRQAEFVVTDGGSNQEESYYFGKSCLLFRAHTERFEGLDSNVYLSNYDSTRVKSFINNYSQWQKKPVTANLSPSQIIFNKLVSASHS